MTNITLNQLRSGLNAIIKNTNFAYQPLTKEHKGTKMMILAQCDIYRSKGIIESVLLRRYKVKKNSERLNLPVQLFEFFHKSILDEESKYLIVLFHKISQVKAKNSVYRAVSLRLAAKASEKLSLSSPHKRFNHVESGIKQYKPLLELNYLGYQSKSLIDVFLHFYGSTYEDEVSPIKQLIK